MPFLTKMVNLNGVFVFGKFLFCSKMAYFSANMTFLNRGWINRYDCLQGHFLMQSLIQIKNSMTDFQSTRYSKTTTSRVTCNQDFIFIEIVFFGIFKSINNSINTIDMGLIRDLRTDRSPNPVSPLKILCLEEIWIPEQFDNLVQKLLNLSLRPFLRIIYSSLAHQQGPIHHHELQ